MQAVNALYPAPRGSPYRHTNIANFGIVLLRRYPQLLLSNFEHDQISGITVRDLRRWWNTRRDLQEAYEEQRLENALTVAAASLEIEETLV